MNEHVVIPYARVEYKDGNIAISVIAPPIATHDLVHVYWMNWLARVGYGIDWRDENDPPCTLRELAKAHWEDHHRMWELEDTMEETYAGIEACIEAETGPWNGRR